MNKAELVESIQGKMGADTSKAAAEAALTAVLDSVKDAIKKAGKAVKGDNLEEVAVSLVGFGSFAVVKRSARTGVNPRTGEKLKIKASKAVKFKAGAGLKDLV